MIHIGQRIKEEFEKQPKNHTISWLASQVNCDRRNVYHIFNRQTIDTDLLYRISVILDHNFFKDLSDDLCHKKDDV